MVRPSLSDARATRPERDPAGDAGDVLGLLSGSEVTVLGPHLGDGGGHGDGDGVGLLPARQHSLPLGLSDRDLVGGVRRVGGREILAHARDCLITSAARGVLLTLL